MINWMFTINDIDEVFSKRMKKKEWPLFNRTPMRKSIRADDRVVFYKAGEDGQRFLGKARLSSDPIKLGDFLYKVKLSDIDLWKNGAKISNLLESLELIPNPTNWSSYLQGGVKKLTDGDFELIVSSSN